jgi:hypothetical protein
MYQNSPADFNEYFLSAARKIVQNMRYSKIKGSRNNADPKYCQITF